MNSNNLLVMASSDWNRKNSTGCLNSEDDNDSSKDSSNGSLIKSRSLPAKSSALDVGSYGLEFLVTSAEDFAHQLTLLDFAVFLKIQPDELSSCAWTKKDKEHKTPNIVAFARRFNHTAFWTVQEVLSGPLPKQRAEIISHFIKIGKKLHELNNLHSLFAIISGLQSASIYRLNNTWSCVCRKDRQSFDRLRNIFSEDSNWRNLREYLESLRLPCIPYLGLFLTDLIYIDLAHPNKNQSYIEPAQRCDKMNNILRVVSNYQHSNYSDIKPNLKIQMYLKSICYIEELQNIFEEDQYKKSLRLEPLQDSNNLCSTPKKQSNFDKPRPSLDCLNILPVEKNDLFVRKHRKCRSLSTNIFGVLHFNKDDRHSESLNGSTQNIIAKDEQQQILLNSNERHLLDDSVLENCQSNITTTNSNNTTTNNSSSCSFKIDDKPKNHKMITKNLDKVPPLCFKATCLDFPLNDHICMEGCISRRTLQKDGRKPTISKWKRYWLQLWANSLIYFPPKSFNATVRNDFKNEPCKVCPLDGWRAKLLSSSHQKDSFELQNIHIGTIYVFRTGNSNATTLWIHALTNILENRLFPKLQQTNLISFE